MSGKWYWSKKELINKEKDKKTENTVELRSSKIKSLW